MSKHRHLQFFLESGLQAAAKAGEHNFIGKMAAVAQESGFDVEYLHHDDPTAPEAFALSHMKPRLHPQTLIFRRVYRYPFWSIEPSAKRWERDVAVSQFHERPATSAATRFFDRWKRRIFGEDPKPSKEGFVYLPLQGKLEQHRSFQTCSPLQMIEQVLENDPKRQVITTLHPNESYSIKERSALEALIARYPRLQLGTGSNEELLLRCNYVVTQNSSAAFFGFFLEKPCVLFGEIDFHHIAVNVRALGAKQAFEKVLAHDPDYASYVHWFWQEMSINAGREGAEAKISAAFQNAGWI